MHVDIQKIIKQDTNPATSEKEDQVLRLEKLISEHIAKMHVETQNVIRVPAETTSKHPNVPSTGKVIRTYPDRKLFVAAEMGNTKFLVELIRQYPDLIWKVNDDNLTIFHIAIKHRHEGIYNLLYEIGSMKDLITPLKDPNGNTMLHLVGKSAKQKRLDDVSGVALQMQRELLWFQEVEAMIPRSYRERKNKDGLTAYELFTMEHKDLVTLGESWMKETANQSFTLPGGYDQNNGLPFFRSKAILMLPSSCSYLSSHTSRYAERDFLESLPKKLMGGLATLILSITTMTITFGVSFFIFYDKGLLWTPILIGVLAVMPVLLYIKLQIGLFVDVIRSTYGSRYLFKPQKHVLYYENPKV
ncbi:ankyrin repeat-containing domain, PGG domain protein [Artemisia annua]|uniref:Ankyrin repeat-containing domain, PGG domain protein n=1 Tax=Artemisia annua TaxID=35608 RepID=A0A2U1Q284_ARTAN|nr:ankyrin repeat-containing domain, PGG domain protein [Artemisia annua]